MGVLIPHAEANWAAMQAHVQEIIRGGAPDKARAGIAEQGVVSLGGAVILLVISKLFRNIAGFLVIVIIALIIYTYFNCWTIESASTFCSTVRALPFL